MLFEVLMDIVGIKDAVKRYAKLRKWPQYGNREVLFILDRNALSKTVIMSRARDH